MTFIGLLILFVNEFNREIFLDFLLRYRFDRILIIFNKNQYLHNFKIMKNKFTQKALTIMTNVIIAIVFTCTANIFAQNSCTFNQNIRFTTRFDNCGQGGRVTVDYSGGQAPYNISIRNLFSGDPVTATLDTTSFPVSLFPGSFEIKTTDANGCEDTTTFAVYAANFKVSVLDCTDSGRRQIQFSNNNNSFLDVSVAIGSFGFNLSAGTSTIVEAPEGTYTARVSRRGCAPYNVTFGVNACSTTRDNQSSAAQEIIIGTKDIMGIGAKVYPNPFNNEFTLDLINTNVKILGTMDVSVFDINGKIVYKDVITDSKTNINLSKLGTGSYFVKVLDAKGAKVLEEQIIKN